MIEQKYIKRFWSYVNICAPDECWVWKRCKIRYGYFGLKGKNVLTHRFAYELTHGEGSAEGWVIRHRCDNPPCCNPKHLIKGTNKDNMNDKIVRGRARHFKGNECSWRKLDEVDVCEIKVLLKKRVFHKDIAKRFNVHTVTITDINLGRTWRHV